MPASPRVRSRYATSTPRAVQAATADDTPYSTSSGCATTHSTRRKASSANGGTKSVAMGEIVVVVGQGKITGPWPADPSGPLLGGVPHHPPVQLGGEGVDLTAQLRVRLELQLLLGEVVVGLRL